MNDYERLLERVKGLNHELAMLQLTAFGQVIESTNKKEKAWNEGSASALQASKELVEKIIEESPDHSADFASDFLDKNDDAAVKERSLKHLLRWLNGSGQ